MGSDTPAENSADQSESRRTGGPVVPTPSDRPTDAVERRPERRQSDELGAQSVADEREIERLRTELERKEEQLRCVTEQYERLLAEKDRKLANASDEDAGPDRRTTRRSRLARFLSSLR